MKYLLGLILIMSNITLSHGYIVGLFERDPVNLPGYKVAQANSWYTDIGHRFSTPLDEDGNFSATFQEMLGADKGGNIGLSVAYGVGNLLDIKLSRYTFTKLYLLSTRVNIMNQAIDKLPLSISTEVNFGLRTRKKPETGRFKRETFGGSFIIARDFLKEKLFFSSVTSYQFNTDQEKHILNENPHHNTFSLGGNAGLRLDRWTLAFEYNRPMSGFMRERNSTIMDNFGATIKYRIYKHQFGLTFNNHDFNSSTDMIAGGNRVQDSNYHMRFGFNIIRQLGGY